MRKDAGVAASFFDVVWSRLLLENFYGLFRGY